MAISMEWKDEIPAEITVDLSIVIGPSKARSLRAWLQGNGMKDEAKEITLVLDSIARWQSIFKEEE